MFMPLSQGEERREGIWLWLHSTALQLILATHGGYPWEEQAPNIPSQRKTVAQVGLKLSVWLRRTLNFWIFYLCFPLAGITSMYHPSSASGIRASSQGIVGAREALYQLSATSDLQSTLITTVVSENPLRYRVLTPVSDVPPGLPLDLLSLQWWSPGLFSVLLTPVGSLILVLLLCPYCQIYIACVSQAQCIRSMCSTQVLGPAWCHLRSPCVLSTLAGVLYWDGNALSLAWPLTGLTLASWVSVETH